MTFPKAWMKLKTQSLPEDLKKIKGARYYYLIPKCLSKHINIISMYTLLINRKVQSAFLCLSTTQPFFLKNRARPTSHKYSYADFRAH